LKEGLGLKKKQLQRKKTESAIKKKRGANANGGDPGGRGRINGTGKKTWVVTNAKPGASNAEKGLGAPKNSEKNAGKNKQRKGKSEGQKRRLGAHWHQGNVGIRTRTKSPGLTRKSPGKETVPKRGPTCVATKELKNKNQELKNCSQT